MEKGPLANRLEYAIFKAISGRKAPDGELTDVIARWKAIWMEKEGGVPQADFADADILSAFKRLWRRELIKLTRYDRTSRQRMEYSGNDADDALFFYNYDFTVTISDEGRSYWDNIQHKDTSIKGFAS